MNHFGFLLALSFLMMAGVGFSSDWEKFYSRSGNFSFHHPAGWQVTEGKSVFTIKRPGSEEEMLIFILSNSTGKTAQQVGQAVIAQLQQKSPGLRIVESKAQSTNLAVLGFEGMKNSNSYRGAALVVIKNQSAVWLSVSTLLSEFSAERAGAILQAASGSMVSGEGSRMPGLKLPPVGSGGVNTQIRSSGARSGAAKDSSKPRTKDEWLEPENKELRGLFGGALISKDLHFYSRSSGVGGTDRTNSVSILKSGGDFRIAFYTDGSVRAQYFCSNSTLSGNITYERFHYEGKFFLKENGKMGTTDMPLVNSPHTTMLFEKHMTKMRVLGNFHSQTNSFLVTVETYDPKKSSWEEFGKNITLYPAEERRTTSFMRIEVDSSHD